MPNCTEQAGCTAPHIAKLRNPQKAQKDAESRRKARKRRKAQKGLFGAGRPKKSVQIAAAQPVVEMAGPVRSRLATQIIYY
jgi:hypothetical protein